MYGLKIEIALYEKIYNFSRFHDTFPLMDTVSGNVTGSNHILIAIWFHIYLTDIKIKENKRLRCRKTY